MTAGQTYDELSKLVGRAFGPGEWITINSEQVERFEAAIGVNNAGIQPLFLLALLPRLATALELPAPLPRTSVNYGLDSMVCHRIPERGQTIRIRMRLLEVGLVDPSLVKEGVQLRRQFVIEDDSGNVILEAVTLSRWMY